MSLLTFLFPSLRLIELVGERTRIAVIAERGFQFDSRYERIGCWESRSTSVVICYWLMCECNGALVEEITEKGWLTKSKRGELC